MSKINGRNHVLLKQEHQSSYAANSDSFNKRYMQGPKVASNQSLSKAHSAEGKTTNRYYSIEMLQYEANSGAVLGQSKIGSLGQLFQSGRSTSQSGCRKQAAESVKQWHNAKPLKGPIGFYMGIHSASFVIVLVIGKFTSWAPSIAIYRIFEFIAVSGMMLDFWAYQTWNSKRDDAAIKVFYASLVPLFLCLLLANEMRGLVAVLWLISSNLVMLQTGHRQTSIHLITFFVLYQAIHVATSVIDTTSSIECILSTNCYTEFLRPTLMGQIGYTVLGIWITTCFLFLEKLLRLNAITLVERDLYMEALFVANMDLKRQLRLFKNENQTQVEAPLETAINTLKHLDEGKAGTDFSTKIAYMVELLGSDQLLQPDFDSGERDSDLRDWLKDILLTSKDGAAKNAEIEEVTSDVVYLNAELSLSEFDPNLSKYLQGYVSKDFDLFKLDEMSHGHALFHLAEQIFSACEFQKKLKLNPEKFSRWILSIEHDHRHVNPYHNSLHAADVTHMMMYLVSLPKIKAFMTTEDLFACFIAAIIHDYMHPGVNGAFLVNTSNVLALRYNDQTVLEHFHCSSFFEMLSNPDINILEGLSNDQKRSFRELVIAMILATDMTVHFDWIGKFKTKMTSSTGINFENKNDKKLCLNMAMKCADINNISKLTNLSVQWTNLVMEEFFLQGDQEKKLSIAVSAFMNRDTTDIAKCQIGFIDFIGLPLYEIFALLHKEELDQHISCIHANRQYWVLQSESPVRYTITLPRKYEKTPEPAIVSHRKKMLGNRRSIMPSGSRVNVTESKSNSGSLATKRQRGPSSLAVGKEDASRERCSSISDSLEILDTQLAQPIMRRKSISAPDLCEILDSELSLQKIPPLNYLDKKANQKLLSEPSVTNIRRAGENEFVMIVVDHIPEEITESTDS